MVQYSLKDMYLIQDVAHQPRLFRLLVHSLCPAILGHDLVKGGVGPHSACSGAQNCLADASAPARAVSARVQLAWCSASWEGTAGMSRTRIAWPCEAIRTSSLSVRTTPGAPATFGRPRRRVVRAQVTHALRGGQRNGVTTRRR